MQKNKGSEIMSCKNCDFARRACNEEYVGCAYWENKRQGDYDIGEDPMTDNEVMDKLNINSFSTGWVYLNRYPEQEKAPDSTVAYNMMTNGVICFKKSFSCNKFKMRT